MNNCRVLVCPFLRRVVTIFPPLKRNTIIFHRISASDQTILCFCFPHLYFHCFSSFFYFTEKESEKTRLIAVGPDTCPSNGRKLTVSIFARRCLAARILQPIFFPLRRFIIRFHFKISSFLLLAFTIYSHQLPWVKSPFPLARFSPRDLLCPRFIALAALCSSS